jgi:bifunctional non-homologous end joining protein LigD
MSLDKYRQKRKFDRTPEPRGTSKPSRGPLRFVVQKHHATRLHYDFRLELDGTLKSWAVPKGPSLNPDDKRLAVMVEDHPLDYRDFEGIIPAGNYGAGSVIVWDEGTYCSRQTSDRQESEKLLREGLEHGHLTFVLNGHKLKGEFALLKLKKGGDNNWLLVKKRDEWASDKDVTADDKSVTSGLTLAEIAEDPPRRGGKRRPRPAPAEDGTRKKAGRRARPDPMPHHVKPMLATPVAKPFDRPGWFFEVKWDGYRAIAEIGPSGVALYSRNQKSFERRYAPLVEALGKLDHEAVLDGEVVVLDERGRSQFQLLQNYQKTGEGHLRYCVFDLLYLDGRDLRDLPLRQRKAQVKQLIRGLADVFLSDHVEDQGIAFFEAVREQGLEGIVAKDGDSPYREGIRSQRWLKIKTHRRQEAVIGGFTEPHGSRRGLGALVLGVYEDKDLVYIGHTGGGFDDASLGDLRSRLEPLTQRACPFHAKPKTNAPVHWVQPHLVCEVTFQQWTEDGIMRQPIFVGLREDKPPHNVHREFPQPLKATPAPSSPAKSREQTPAAQADPRFSNLQKVYWPKEGYTKGDLIEYYRSVADVILPYLRDRPQSLHRHPNGIEGSSFFQKDVSRQPPPPWVATVPVPSESAGGDILFLLCQDQRTLLYLANLGCIELNPWNSRVGTLDRPDYLVIDLDPEKAAMTEVVEAALAVRKVLERAAAPCLCKTSGKRGLHVYVPLGARYDYDHARQFAEIVATMVHRQLPASTSILRRPALRQGRVYLDFLQNRRGQTLAAPYSVRPWPGATVSTPLAWKEVNKRLDPAKFTIRTMLARLEKVGDLWTPIQGGEIDLADCLQRLTRA